MAEQKKLAVPRSVRTTRELHKEGGFTLIELLIVVVILPLVVGAIALGLVSVFSLQTRTAQRLSGSTDLQVVTARFVKDVQGALTVTNDPGATQACGTTGTQLLGITMQGGSVSYVQIPIKNGGTQYALERLSCRSNSTSPTTPNVSVISSDLTAGQAAPQVCDDAWVCGPTTTYVNANKVAAVKFSLVVPMSSVPYMMIATPRTGYGTITAPTGGTLPSPLTLLGTDCSNLLTVGGGKKTSVLSINVGGVPYSGTLGLANCTASAVSLANGGSILASGLVSGVSTVGGIQVGAQPGSYPTNIISDPSLYGVNPFSTIPAPPLPTAAESCTPTSKNVYNCQPGKYGPISFANGATINFAPGNYSFSSDFYLPNGSTTTFGAGTYSFLASDYNAFGTGTNGISIFGTDVLLYSPSGSMTFGNNSAVALKNDQLANPLYKGVTVWDAATYNSAQGVNKSVGVVTLGNNASQVNSYGGIYVPNGIVVDSNNGTIATDFIVAGSALFSNGLSVNINQP